MTHEKEKSRLTAATDKSAKEVTFVTCLCYNITSKKQKSNRLSTQGGRR